jgi:hypothetical protein
MRKVIAAGLTALSVCAVIAAGCGGGSSTTTTTSTGGNAQQSIPAAIKSCIDQAHQLGGPEGASLASACTKFGHGAKKAVSKIGKQRKQALSNAALACRNGVKALLGGQAQAEDTLSKLCDAIASAK